MGEARVLFMRHRRAVIPSGIDVPFDVSYGQSRDFFSDLPCGYCSLVIFPRYGAICIAAI